MFSYRLINRPLLISLCCIAFYIVKAQEFSTRGKDFWAGYGSHVSMYDSINGMIKDSGGAQNMVLYFSATKQAKVHLEIPGTGWSTNYIVNSGSVKESDTIPKEGLYDARLAEEGVFNRGIHITSDEPIAVYCHIYDNSIAGASLIFPTNTLGQDYTVLNFTQESNDDFCHSFCFVIATEDSTIIEVTPSENTLTHKKGETFTQSLQKGEVLNLLGELIPGDGNVKRGVDLTGTTIRTINNGTNSCKKIAVFCGTTKTAMRCMQRGLLSSDNMIQQMVPSNGWGKRYITIPTKDMASNFFRIMVKDPATIVFHNGVQLTNIVNGLYYEIVTDQPSLITADQNILVAQYITTINKCGNNSGANLGDPEIIYLSPVDKKINNLSIISTPRFSILKQYINVLIKTNDINSFLLDGTNRAASFTVFSFDNSYSYAQFLVREGTHKLYSDSGFSVIVYGYGNHESYAYNGGFETKYTYKALSVENPFAIPKIPQTCDSTQFKITVTFPYQPVNLYWDFFNNPRLSPNDSLYMDNPIPESSYIDNGQPYYVYKFPASFMYDVPENFDFRVISAFPTQDGCYNLIPNDYTIEVFEKPVAECSISLNLCANDTLLFIDKSNAFQKTITQWIWNFDDGTSSSMQNPIKKYSNDGDYNVELRVITDIGCFADTAQSMHLSSTPKVDFSVNGNDCFGNILSFKDLSTTAGDSIVKWSWDFGDNTSSSLQNPTKSYNTSDTFQVQLLAYNKDNCVGDTTKSVIVYPNPTITAEQYQVVFENNSLAIQAEYTGTGLKYKWIPPFYLNSDMIPNPVTKPKDDIRYNISVIGDGGCTASKDILVHVIHLLQIPNSFSPNGDGINDKWMIFNIDKYPESTVEVFNRYGQQLFYSVGYSRPWDGTYQSQPLPVGTYYYIINTRSKYLPVYSGYVVVLR